MSNDNGKISVRQGMLLIILIFSAPAIRYIPLYTSERAKQAAWLSPIFAFVLEVIYLFAWWSIFKKHETKSFVDIIKDITGKYFGYIMCLFYFLWITFLLSYNVRMYAERLVSTSMANVNIIFVLLIMMLIVGLVMKNGIIPLAKMCEIFFVFLVIVFTVYNILILPEVHTNNLFPITYKDALPIFEASMGIIAIFAYNIVVFMFNDKIDHKGEFKKVSFMTIIMLFIISILVIVIPLCVFGHEILDKMPIPYLNTMMQISIFDIIERVEAGVLMFWILTDFVLISVFIYAALHLLKVTFKISNTRPLLIIYIIFVFFLSLNLSKSTLELKVLSENVITYANILMGYAIPILIFFVGKIRKKI